MREAGSDEKISKNRIDQWQRLCVTKHMVFTIAACLHNLATTRNLITKNPICQTLVNGLLT